MFVDVYVGRPEPCGHGVWPRVNCVWRISWEIGRFPAHGGFPICWNSSWVCFLMSRLLCSFMSDRMCTVSLQTPYTPLCISSHHRAKFSVIWMGSVYRFSPTYLDLSLVSLCFFPSLSLSLFISVFNHIFHETLRVSSVSAPENGWCRNVSSAGSWWCWNRVPKRVSTLF